MNESATRSRLRFSVFEADLDSGELFKKGAKVRLQGQPFELLVHLLKNPGCVVTREELKDRLWPGDTAGDFDSGLNRAINRIREVLGDSAESPHFIETLPRRGYRFIGTVSNGSNVEPTPVATNVDVKAPNPVRRGNWYNAAILGVYVTALVAVIWFARRHSLDAPRTVKLRQITTNSSENPVLRAVISPDGRYLGYGDLNGIRIQEILTGQTHALSRPAVLSAEDAWFPVAWFPDGTRMLASAIRTGPDGNAVSSVWSVPVLGKPTLLRDDAFPQSVSPDGALVVFTRMRASDETLGVFSCQFSREIWIMGPYGEDARKLQSDGGKTLFGSVQWSPNGDRIVYSALHPANNGPNSPDLETVALKGGAPTVVLPNFSESDSDFGWFPNGRFIYSQPEPAPNNLDTNLWEMKVDPESGRPQTPPRAITHLTGFQLSNISASSDGRRLNALKTSSRSDIYVARLRPGGGLDTPRRLTFDERTNLPFAWTLDSKSVIFTSDRTGVVALYKQAIDQDLAELIPTGPQRVWLPRATPDGSSIVYFALSDVDQPWNSRFIQLMRVPVGGGPRDLLFQFAATGGDMSCPTRANASCIVEEGPVEGGTAAFVAFNPITGGRRELFRQTDLSNWTVSPDGAYIGALRGRTIQILSLTGQTVRSIRLSGWPYVQTIDWAADGKAFLISHAGPTMATLLRVGLDGKVEVLWAMKGFLYTWAIASPDGQYLAIKGQSLNSNAWLLQDF